VRAVSSLVDADQPCHSVMLNKMTAPTRYPLPHPMECAMLKDNLFQKIIDKQIPASIVYEDDRCLAFRDVNPQAPTHVLIIPRKIIATHEDITEADRELLGHLHLVAAKLAKQFGLSDGY